MNRRIARLALLVLWVTTLMVACSLNPQPLPPGNASESNGGSSGASSGSSGGIISPSSSSSGSSGGGSGNGSSSGGSSGSGSGASSTPDASLDRAADAGEARDGLGPTGDAGSPLVDSPADAPAVEGGEIPLDGGDAGDAAPPEDAQPETDAPADAPAMPDAPEGDGHVWGED